MTVSCPFFLNEKHKILAISELRSIDQFDDSEQDQIDRHDVVQNSRIDEDDDACDDRENGA